MPLYELRDDLGNRLRVVAKAGDPPPDGYVISGVVFGALPDGSGGFVTDEATADAVAKAIAPPATPAAP